MFKKIFYIIFFIFLFSILPVKSLAANDFFIHISDTHVADDSNHANQKSILSDWVIKTNNSLPQFTINTGDLADHTYKPSDLGIYMSIVNNLINPHVYISGNHDYQGNSKYYYSTLGYNEYPVATYGNYIIVGSPSAINVSINWDKLEQNMKLGKGEKKVVLLQHIPFFAPTWVSCFGGICNAPKWILSANNALKFKELIKKYDIGTVLSGHLHTAYIMKDKELFFDDVGAAGLQARRQNVITENNGELCFQDGKYYEQSMVIVSPTRYDSQTNLGMILTNEPISLKYLGKTNITQVQYKIGNTGIYYNMTQDNNIWSANIDWTKYKRSFLYNLYIRAILNGVLVREITQQIRISPSYPNARPVISYNNPDFYKTIFSGLVSLNMNFNDDNYDVNLVELFIDGIRKNYWSYKSVKSGSVTYQWDTSYEAVGKHILRFKITDQFGRKTYSDKFEVQVGTQTITPSSTPIPTITNPLTPTLIPTITNTITPIPTPTCTANFDLTTIFQQGQNNFTGTSDTYFFIPNVTPPVNKPEDNQSWNAPYIKTSGYYPKYRTLLKFNLSSIPLNGKIKSANLTFTLASWDGQTEKPTQKIAKLNKPFNQSTASWINASSTQLWSTPGADEEGVDYLSPVKSKLINWGANTIDVTDFVQSWVSNQNTNYGLLIWETDLHSTSYYSSRYTVDVTKRPKLTVVYSTCN